MSKKETLSLFNEPTATSPFSFFKLTYTVGLLIAGIILGYTASFVPNGHHHLFALWQDTIIKYVPHKAPASAYLGKFENEKGSFKVKDSLFKNMIIDNREWAIDSTGTKYLTKAEGTVDVQTPDGHIEKGKITVEDEQNYDLLKLHNIPFIYTPQPVTDFFSDAALRASIDKDGIHSRLLWEKIQTLNDFPYQFKAAGIAYSIDMHGKMTDTAHPNVFTALIIGTQQAVNGKEKAKPFKLIETRTFSTK